jgi:hypothetical protein
MFPQARRPAFFGHFEQVGAFADREIRRAKTGCNEQYEKSSTATAHAVFGPFHAEIASAGLYCNGQYDGNASRAISMQLARSLQ